MFDNSKRVVVVVFRTEKDEREVNIKGNRINPSHIYHVVPDASSLPSKIAEVITEVELNHEGNSWKSNSISCYISIILSLFIQHHFFIFKRKFTFHRIYTHYKNSQTSRMSCVNCLLKDNLRDFQPDIREEM